MIWAKSISFIIPDIFLLDASSDDIALFLAIAHCTIFDYE